MQTTTLVLFNIICGLLSVPAIGAGSLGLAVIAVPQTMLVWKLLSPEEYSARSKFAVALYTPLILLLVTVVELKGWRGTRSGVLDAVGLFFTYFWFAIPAGILVFHFWARLFSRLGK